MTIELSSQAPLTRLVGVETAKAAVNPAKQDVAHMVAAKATHSPSAEVLGITEEEDKRTDKANPASEGELEEVAGMLAEVVSMTRKGLNFRVDELEGAPVVSVTDLGTGELIRQIPSEEALALAEKMSEMAGLLIKTEA
ncbi:MAG: flagellar protein FlaG [Plesiomonas shigelloides]